MKVQLRNRLSPARYRFAAGPAGVSSTPSSKYAGHILTAGVETFLRRGNILAPDGTAIDMLDRLRATVADREMTWTSKRRGSRLAESFVADVVSGRSILGTPGLTNLAQGSPRPLSSCTSPWLLSEPWETAWADNMGMGFNLSQIRKPSAYLLEIEQRATRFEGSHRGRYVGNIAHIPVNHADVEAFIGAKTKPIQQLSHLNTSVDFSLRDIAALRDPRSHPSKVLRCVAEAAWLCGDPGIISLDRFNAANPLRGDSPFTTVAPCAEVGLAPGDTCTFGYLSLPAFLKGDSITSFDFEHLDTAVDTLVRVLDLCLDQTIATVAAPQAQQAARRRRIAVSVCGYADLLLWLRIPYGSSRGLDLLDRILRRVQRQAKLSSTALGAERGTWSEASAVTQYRNRTALVTSATRHSSLTALPPSGRSSWLMGVNASIEPYLAAPRTAARHPSLQHFLRDGGVDADRTGIDVSWQDQLAVTATAARVVDDAVSKTINLPSNTSVAQVEEIFRSALDAGLKAISIYRDPRA